MSCESQTFAGELAIPVKTISSNLLVDQSTVRRTLRLFDNTGIVDKKAYNCFKKDVQLYLLELVIENPGMYLTEMKKELHARGRRIKEANFTKKKMRLVAMQRSEELRAKYLSEVVLYNPNMQKETKTFTSFTSINPNSVVVLDNASVNYHEKVRELIVSVLASI